MINLKNLKAGKRGAHDIAKYLEHLRDEGRGVGYYQSGGAPSEWHGSGARDLGLEGAVRTEDLARALEGKLPNGADLSRRGNRQDDRRMGVDLTFSAPKSVSIAGLGAGDERLLKAHDEAVRKALDFIEKEVITARHGRGGVEREQTCSMVAAVYRHEDSRPVNGHTDPQLHSHSIVINATQRADGAWSAMDLQFGEHSILMHTADAVYKSELARAAQQMGYEIRRTNDGFELAHITDAQIDHFSQRRDQVDAELERRNTSREQASGSEKAAANLATRERKQQIDKQAQAWAWRQEAREAGVSLDHPQERGQAARDLSAEAVKAGTRHIAERETVFSRDALRLESLKAGMGDADLAGVERELGKNTGGLIEAGAECYTTKDALHREQEILHRARSGAGKADPFMTPDQARNYISDREAAQGFQYSEGQRQALELGLTSTDSVIGIVGAAGAGKTTAMADMVRAAQAAGHEVIGIAPSARARNELESAGAEVNRTTASFLSREHDHNPQRVVIMDEAGMVSAKDMDALLKKMEAEGGRLILVGDPRQLKAVEAGSPFQQMMESDAIRVATIDEIKRQRDPDLREIAQAFARGEAGAATVRAMEYTTEATITMDPAIEHKRDRDGNEIPTTQERREGIAQATAEAYLDLPPDDRARTLVISGTNDVRSRANHHIREGLKDRGEVSRNEIKITAFDKADLTREKATHAESYKAGMVVRFEKRGADGKREVRDYGVTGIDGNRVRLRDAADNEKTWNPAKEKAAGVYQPREMGVSAGDQIIFRENQGRGADKITNGQTATITKAGPDGIEVRFDNGRSGTLDPARGQTIDYAWCRTVHASQGATVDNVIVAGEASRVATAESAYVACSRERESLKIVTDNPVRLQKSWEKWADKKHAMTAAQDASLPNLEQLRDLRAAAAAELGRDGDLTKTREAAEPEPSGKKDQPPEKDSGKHTPAPDNDHDKGPAPAAPVKDQEKESAPKDAASKAMEATGKRQGVEAPGSNHDKEKAQGKEKDQSKEAAPAKPPTKDRGLDHDLGLER